MKTLNKAYVSRQLEISSIAAGTSILLLVILGFISVAQQDLRYIGVAISIFSICYMGHFAYWFWCIHKRDKGSSLTNDILSFIIALLYSAGAVGLFVYGIAVFLHHYDIDALINFYIESINHLKNYIK